MSDNHLNEQVDPGDGAVRRRRHLPSQHRMPAGKSSQLPPASSAAVCVGPFKAGVAAQQLNKNPRHRFPPQIHELSGPDLKPAGESEKPDGLKCAALGASPSAAQQLATGSFKGRLQVWDLERLSAAPVFDAQAHAAIVNAVDGFGGRARGYGPPEIATGGGDGAVRVWDVRQPDAPVAAFEPADAGGARWAGTHAWGGGWCMHGRQPSKQQR
jgi:hypothetical protein